MICVSIGRGRHKHMIAEHRHLVEQGAQIVELRLDYIRRAVNLKRLLTDRPCPVIVTCRREQDGGHWTASEADRQILLRSAIVEGVDYVDLEDDIAGGIPRYGTTRRIISYHNFRETPPDLGEIHKRLCGLDPDIVKLATMAHDPHDNVRMLELIRQSEVPTVGMCMGDIGTPSRILAGRFGAPFTYATFHQERALAPGQLSYRQMIEIYDYEHINADTEFYGVVADPIGHSLSPLVHNRAFHRLKLKKVYLPFRVPREHLSGFLADCRQLGVRGLSVTIPHKEQVLEHCDSVDEAATGIGAANTLVFENGVIHGYNTDCQAAIDSILSALGSETSNPLARRPTLILGAGGVAKAIGFGLVAQGAEVSIASRSLGRARDLAERLKCKAVEWERRHEVKAGLLINCTPVGMHPNVDETPYDERHLRRTTMVFDTVYNPEQTLLIKQARDHGCRTITGVDMFVRQAALQFRLFTGQEPPFEEMRVQVKRAIGAANY